ncbi:MAG: outer membrane protein OmpA-like peptidoglycan-associated protein [Sulfurimonas sp.]|jgi:outer membrane protein OmpA-like peptidoglycan-associated protein|uniref:OmpA family protein n=1 Tax=Sulfurimonas sp. TaxID=2022749 RepID=UPI0039E6D22A
MKKIVISTCLSMSLFVASSIAKECIMVEDLNVEFNNASAVYSNDSERQEIINFAKFMKETNVYAVVEGHTSSLDNAAYNYKLSTKRAVKVMQELKNLGVKKSHVRAMGFGESSPLYTNNTQEGAAQNRRVIAEVFNSAEELDAYMKSQKSKIKDILLTEQ